MGEIHLHDLHKIHHETVKKCEETRVVDIRHLGHLVMQRCLSETRRETSLYLRFFELNLAWKIFRRRYWPRSLREALPLRSWKTVVTTVCTHASPASRTDMLSGTISEKEPRTGGLGDGWHASIQSKTVLRKRRGFRERPWYRWSLVNPYGQSRGRRRTRANGQAVALTEPSATFWSIPYVRLNGNRLCLRMRCEWKQSITIGTVFSFADVGAQELLQGRVQPNFSKQKISTKVTRLFILQ